MRKFVVLCGLALALALPAMAQQEESTPRFDVSGGYSYLRLNLTATPTGSPTLHEGANGNGGSGSLAFNLTGYFGIVGDFGMYHASPNYTILGVPVSATGLMETYMGGPRITYNRHGGFSPFVQGLVGAAHGSETTTASGASLGTASKTVLAFTVGGGVDLNLTHRISVRVIQAEYFFTNFTSSASSGLYIPHQNNVRVTFGFVFHL